MFVLCKIYIESLEEVPDEMKTRINCQQMMTNARMYMCRSQQHCMHVLVVVVISRLFQFLPFHLQNTSLPSCKSSGSTRRQPVEVERWGRSHRLKYRGGN